MPHAIRQAYKIRLSSPSSFYRKTQRQKPSRLTVESVANWKVKYKKRLLCFVRLQQN